MMSEIARRESASYSLSDYAAMLRRRWAWLVFGLLIGLGAGWLANTSLSPTYVSQANVLVEPTGVSSTTVANGRTSGEINLDTEAQLVKSAEVATKAQAELGSTTPLTELVDQVTITVPPNSQILSIAFEADSATAAQRGAQAFAQAYLDSRAELAAADVTTRTAELEKQIKSASAALGDVLDQLASLALDNPERVFAESRRSQLSDRIASLTQQVQDLSTLDDRPGRIIDPAVLPDSRSGPGTVMIYASSLMLGLLLGLGLMLLRERADRRLHTPHEAARDTGLRVLGVVPPTTAWGANRREERKAYERLRNAVVSTAGRERVLLVTGADRQASVVTVAANLAGVLAATDRRVVLIDATPDSSARQLRDQPGLSDALAERGWAVAGLSARHAEWSVASPADYVRIGPGTRPDRLHHLLASHAASSSFDDLRQLADVALVVVPYDDVGSPQTIAILADGVIHVAVRRRSRRPDVVTAVQRTVQVGTPSVGLVIVDYPPRLTAAYRSIRHAWRLRRASARTMPTTTPEVATAPPVDTSSAAADLTADAETAVLELAPIRAPALPLDTGQPSELDASGEADQEASVEGEPTAGDEVAVGAHDKAIDAGFPHREQPLRASSREINLPDHEDRDEEVVPDGKETSVVRHR
jgi:succinoglycan biosynthesis transport protein ExoP